MALLGRAAMPLTFDIVEQAIAQHDDWHTHEHLPERLNNPSPWTRKMMSSYRAMTRGLCTVARSHGLGMGGFGLLVRFEPAGDSDASLEQWLGVEVMPRLALRPGLGSVHLLRSGLTPEMTSEQRIRGADSGVDWALLATGYERSARSAPEPRPGLDLRRHQP